MVYTSCSSFDNDPSKTALSSCDVTWGDSFEPSALFLALMGMDFAAIFGILTVLLPVAAGAAVVLIIDLI